MHQVPDSKKKEKSWIFAQGVITGVLAVFCVLLLASTARLLCARYQITLPWEQKKEGQISLTDNNLQYKLKSIENLINQYALEEVDQENMEKSLFEGIAAGLEDPYARYYTAEEYAKSKQEDQNAYYGIGISLQYIEDQEVWQISSVYEDSPAWDAGIREGDIFIKYGEEAVTAENIEDIIEEIQNTEGSFSLTMERDGDPIELELNCELVENPVVTGQMLTEEIGYLRIKEFKTPSADQFEEELKSLQAEGMQQLIVDLRNNPGGMLKAVCSILDDLLPEELIVYTEDKKGKRREYTSDADQIFQGEIVILVNSNSASASEVFTGTLQDYGLALVMGTTTYGKGIVQSTYQLSDGSAFKFTVEHYYTPSGREIQGKGIAPDIVVEEAEEADLEDPTADAAIQKALQQLKKPNTEEGES